MTFALEHVPVVNGIIDLRPFPFGNGAITTRRCGLLRPAGLRVHPIEPGPYGIPTRHLRVNKNVAGCMTHHPPPFLPDQLAHQFREMCWGCGSARAGLVVERDNGTHVVNGIWCWLCSRAVHRDCPSKEHPSDLWLPRR